MTRRRTYGSGSLHQRKDGIWVGTIEAGWTASGARRRVTVSSRDRGEALRKLKARQRQVDAEGHTGTSARATVKTWAEEWLELRRSSVRPQPWATDASAIRRWIVPTIGHRRLDELTPADLRAVRRAQTDAGKSTTTARRTHTTLTAMLRAAILEGHAVPQRVLLVEAPGLAETDRDAMPVPKVLLVLEEAFRLLPHWSRWLMQVYSGMRPAEVLGTTWDAVDLDAGTLRVEWQLKSLPWVDRTQPKLGFRKPDSMRVRHLTGAYHLTEPKTKAGFRVVPLVPAMVEQLRAWRDVAPANPWGLVWPTLAGRPTYDVADRDEWYGLQGNLGIGHPAGRYYYVHEARHGLATRLLETGADPKVVIELMGHTSILTTRGYQHGSLEARLAAMTKATEQLKLG